MITDYELQYHVQTSICVLPKLVCDQVLPALLSAAEADGSSELTLAFSDRGIVKGELFPMGYAAHGVESYGQAAPTCHHLGLAVGAAAVTDPACKGSLHADAFPTSYCSYTRVSSALCLHHRCA